MSCVNFWLLFIGAALVARADLCLSSAQIVIQRPLRNTVLFAHLGVVSTVQIGQLRGAAGGVVALGEVRDLPGVATAGDIFQRGGDVFRHLRLNAKPQRRRFHFASQKPHEVGILYVSHGSSARMGLGVVATFSGTAIVFSWPGLGRDSSIFCSRASQSVLVRRWRRNSG